MNGSTANRQADYIVDAYCLPLRQFALQNRLDPYQHLATMLQTTLWGVVYRSLLDDPTGATIPHHALREIAQTLTAPPAPSNPIDTPPPTC